MIVPDGLHPAEALPRIADPDFRGQFLAVRVAGDAGISDEEFGSILNAQTNAIGERLGTDKDPDHGFALTTFDPFRDATRMRDFHRKYSSIAPMLIMAVDLSSTREVRVDYVLPLTSRPDFAVRNPVGYGVRSNSRYSKIGRRLIRNPQYTTNDYFVRPEAAETPAMSGKSILAHSIKQGRGGTY